MLKPRSQWPNPDKEKSAVVAEIERVSKGVYGNNYEFTQPIQMRFNELISGVRTDVAVKFMVMIWNSYLNQQTLPLRF